MSNIKPTKKHREAISNMILNPAHRTSKPSDLIRSNTAYKGFNRDDIDYCKAVAYKGGVSTGPEVTNTTTKGDETNYTIVSDKPLQPKEIEELVGVDGIKNYVKQTWLKSHNSGKWTYSILTVNVINDFYTIKELQNRLATVLPKVIAKTLPKVISNTKSLLTLNLSDIHAEALGNDKTPFPTDYNKSILSQRLSKFATESLIFTKGKVYEECWLLNLGDSINSWKNQTTRKGHDVPSESNKTQFDIFVSCLSQYYETIFNSGISKNYTVISILNDNHAGIDLSYMATRAVELYMMGKYPQVKFIHQEEFIKIYSYGNHRIALTHGKDEKIMKFPMKMFLDEKLDNWLLQYFNHHDCNQTKTFNNLIKGDLHSKNEMFGKFGRYVNLPSVMGTSDYIALNYGFSRSGAVIEEYEKELNNITTKTVWFQ